MDYQQRTRCPILLILSDPAKFSKSNGVLEEAVLVRLFAFSFIGDAERWLNSFPNHHFKSWEQLWQQFMNEYFQQTKSLKIKRQIQDFKQAQVESLSEAWKRFEELRRQLLMHMLVPWDVISSFYGPLRDELKMMLDSSTIGLFFKLGIEEADGCIKTIATNTPYWYNSQEVKKKDGLECMRSTLASHEKHRWTWQCRRWRQSSMRFH